MEDVKKRLQTLSYGADVSDILSADSDYNTGRQLSSDFILRSGIRSLPQVKQIFNRTSFSSEENV